MRLGVEFVPYIEIDKMVSLAKLVERLRFSQIWICDHYHNRYVHTVLTRLALSTSKISLGPGVTNPYTAHPAITATAIATLNEISAGRAILGISAGDPLFLQTVGLKQEKPVRAVEEAIKIIRGLLSGRTIFFNGEIFKCQGARLRFDPGGHIPIYVGGRREKMLKLAGRLGDGVLINASHPEDIRESLSFVRDGMRVKKKNFDFVAYMAVSIDDDPEVARKLVRGVVSFIASSAPKSSLERHGINEKDVEKVRRRILAGSIEKAREEVTPEMIEAFSVTGPLKVLEERIEALRKLGITTVVVGSPIGRNKPAVLKQISSRLL
ncbi:MAG: 5,10-methylenetetrahydromethanopterin reductase [Candidatus Hadarchaeales archaeon]